jgi:general secretion pathway protein G
MMKAKSGFTLVEILIVVVILGILAAIVIPQFTNASTEAKESSLMSDLQSIRSQIQLYKVQHNDLIPGEILSGGTVTDATAASFVEALCSKTDQYGNVDNTNGLFGPYMKKLPANPFSNVDDVVTFADFAEDGASVSIGATALTTANETTGWYLVVNRGSLDHGHFQANDGLSNPVTDQLHVDY